MRIYTILLFIGLVLLPSLIWGQADGQRFARNAVTVETGGVMWNWYSLNYERTLVRNSAWELQLRIGGSQRGYFRKPFDWGIEKQVSALGGLNLLMGKRNNRFEIGLLSSFSYNAYLGGMCGNGLDFDTYDYSHGIEHLEHRIGGYLGYRYQRPGGGLVIKVGLAPTWQTNYGIIRYNTGETEIGRGYANKWEKFNVYPSLAIGWGF